VACGLEERFALGAAPWSFMTVLRDLLAFSFYLYPSESNKLNLSSEIHVNDSDADFTGINLINPINQST